MIPRTTAATARLAIMWCLFACPADPAAAQSVPYVLSPGAEFHTGCFTPPCTCAPIQNPLSGQMVLVRQPTIGSFAQYDVEAVNWQVQFPDGVVPVVGSGHYRVGGTGTIQQQLTLDVSVGGASVLHFDSGLVPGGDQFPRLDVAVSLRGQAACDDTVMIVRGGPGGSLGVAATGVSLRWLAPNPFRSSTRLTFALREAGPVRVTVHDPAGRVLRTLVDGARLEAGLNEVDWDGRGADGRALPAGRYFVRVQAAGRSERVSVVKLR